MRHIKSPEQYYNDNDNIGDVFLGGSIEMGLAEPWQERLVELFKDTDLRFLNPRRTDWDSSWVQEASNPQFAQQVNWELNKLENSHIIFMYFSPETQSPISLLELGRFAGRGNMIVCCPKGFWRKGNVDILCTRENIPLFEDLQSAIGALKTKISQCQN